MDNEAYQTLLWQEQDLGNIYLATNAWEGFGEPGQLRVSGAQISQWSGAWRVWKHRRWTLLEVLEDYLPAMEMFDVQKFWDVLTETNGEAEIKKMRKRFLEIAFSGSDEPASSYVGRVMTGSKGGMGTIEGVDECFDFVRDNGGQQEVDILFGNQALWIMKNLPQQTVSLSLNQRSGREIWTDILERVSDSFFHSKKEYKTLSKLLGLYCLRRYGQGYASELTCSMLIQEVGERGADLNEMLFHLQDMEEYSEADRLEWLVGEILTLGAKWENVDMDTASDLMKRAILNHPSCRRDKLLKNHGKNIGPGGEIPKPVM